jgi:hypothetical protein
MNSFKRRSQLRGKSSKDIPSIADRHDQSIHGASTIYINESLTPYRRKLFGKINEFKRSRGWKHIWSVNGKILLRHTDNSEVVGFVTFEDFDQFLDRLS